MEYDAILRLLLVLIMAAAVMEAMDPDVPKQMKRIYRRFKQGKLPRKGINSVRCIRAHPGSASSNGKLLFSLDAIHKQEELIKAEIYFYRRSHDAASMLQTDLYEISPYYQSLVQSEVIKSGSDGWVDIDITPTIKQCTNTLNTNNQVGVNYYTISQGKATEPIDINEFSRHHGLPFLLIYTNNSRSLDMDQISGLNEQPISDELDLVLSQPEKSKKPKEARRMKRSVSDGKGSTDNTNYQVNTDLVELDRKMNQISNGHYYWEGADDYFNELTNAVESNGMDNKPTDYQVKVHLPMPFSTEEPIKQEHKIEKPMKTTLQLLPWPKLTKKKQVKDSKSENVIPTDWGQPARDKKSSGCRREAMRLNFEDIGWGLRIIEPKKYDAYYCTGQCGFPYALGMKPTNHATLQSILSSLHRNNGVPQPCCVADRLSPLTIMFRDAAGDIVVKLYKNMVVESCSCR